MGLAEVAVWFMLSIISFVCSVLLGRLISWMNDDDDPLDTLCFAPSLILSMALSTSLTYIFWMKGII